MNSIYNKITEKIQFITPGFYRERYFKKLKNLTQENVLQLNVEPELLWVTEYLRKKAVVMEIGANVGVYLYQFQKILPPENIIAFEPNRKLYVRLKRIFQEMRIFPLAISDENTMAEFKIPVIKGKEISSRGTLQTAYEEKDEQRTIKHTVKVIRLDDWAEIEHITRLDFIKIDVEGNEMLTLRGAKQSILKFRPTLMVEMEQRHHEKALWQHICEIAEWGYLPKYLSRTDFELKDLTEEIVINQDPEQMKNKQMYINNIIFIPKQ